MLCCADDASTLTWESVAQRDGPYCHNDDHSELITR